MTGNPNPRSLSLGIVSVQVNSSKNTSASGASSVTKSKSPPSVRRPLLKSPLVKAREALVNELNFRDSVVGDLWFELSVVASTIRLPLPLVIEAAFSCPDIEISYKLGSDGYRMIRLLP